MNTLNQVKNTLLSPYGITERDIDKIMDTMLVADVCFADIYFASSHFESWTMEGGIVKGGVQAIEQGASVRAISGGKTAFAYSDQIDLATLLGAANNVQSIAARGGSCAKRLSAIDSYPRYYSDSKPLQSLTDLQKVELLRRTDRAIRRQDSRITEVIINLTAADSQVLIARSDGSLAADIRPLVRMNVCVILQENGRREQGNSGGGARDDYSYFLHEDRAMAYAEQALHQASVACQAVAAPAGDTTVVLGAGWPGILLHEAIGHGLEGDFNRKGTSVFSGKIGERIASELCTIVDDGTIAGRRGSLNIDDEGTPSEYTTLIENGVLKGYMQDLQNGRLMAAKSTGNGRRESYAYPPMPRMTNTYMLAGKHSPEEIIKSVGNGLYAKNFSGGQVDITSGKFVFSTSEAYLIKNGKITNPVKGATLIGSGDDVLGKVSMVGNDLQLDSGVGTCGKDGQSVPVGVGQPTLKVDTLTVGGTQV